MAGTPLVLPPARKINFLCLHATINLFPHRVPSPPWTAPETPGLRRISRRNWGKLVDIAQDQIADELASVTGVGAVMVLGGGGAAMNCDRRTLSCIVQCAAVALVFAGLIVAADEEKTDTPQPVETITANELVAHISYLASDELEGRDTPSPGLEKAADYIAAEFKKYGLSPAGANNSYFQDFYMLDGWSLGPKNRLESYGETENKTYSMPKSFVPFDFSACARAGFSEDDENMTPNVVFAGYGVSDEKLDYDDYDGIDVKGRIVLVLSHEPQERKSSSKFDGTKPTKWSDPYEKGLNAQKHGAAGVLLVTGPNTHLDLKPRGSNWAQFQSETDKLIEQVLHYAELLVDEGKEPEEPPEERPSLTIPIVHVSQTVACDLLAPMKKDLAKLQQKIDKACEPCSFAIEGSSIAMEVDVKRVRDMRVKNVAAVLPGADPALAQEYVMVCAHYDHIGTAPAAAVKGGGGERRSGKSGDEEIRESGDQEVPPIKGGEGGVGHGEETDRIFNGADDNASGTAGVLEIAQAFASAGHRPARSMIFIAWAGEEKGFLGSMYFLKNPLVPLKSIGALVNLDMIGRGKEKEVLATGPLLGKALLKTSQKHAESLGLALSYIPLPRILAVLGGSDHSPFLMKGIPGIHLFAGMHEDYHKVSDEVDKIVPTKAQAIARLAYLIAESMAESRE